MEKELFKQYYDENTKQKLIEEIVVILNGMTIPLIRLICALSCSFARRYHQMDEESYYLIRDIENREKQEG